MNVQPKLSYDPDCLPFASARKTKPDAIGLAMRHERRIPGERAEPGWPLELDVEPWRP